jgi:hypothetical protein
MLENQVSWGKHLPLAEFSYNNSYQVDAVHLSIGLSQERKSYLVLTLSMKPKQRYTVLKTTKKP